MTFLAGNLCLFLKYGLFAAMWSSCDGAPPRGHPEHRAVDPDTKPRHFGDVMQTGKLLSPNVYFQI
jgi:hypothetical protein